MFYRGTKFENSCFRPYTFHAQVTWEFAKTERSPLVKFVLNHNYARLLEHRLLYNISFPANRPLCWHYRWLKNSPFSYYHFSVVMAKLISVRSLICLLISSSVYLFCFDYLPWPVELFCYAKSTLDGAKQSQCPICDHDEEILIFSNACWICLRTSH